MAIRIFTLRVWLFTKVDGSESRFSLFSAGF